MHRLARTSVTASSGQGAADVAPSLMELLLSVHILQQPLLDLMLSVLLAACEEHAATLAHGGPAAAPPPLVSREKAADLAGRTAPASLSARWDSICGLPHNSSPHRHAGGIGSGNGVSQPSASEGGLPEGEGPNRAGPHATPGADEGAPQSTHWSPASLFALMQPHRFLSHYHALAPPMILASGRAPEAAAPPAAGYAAHDSKQHIRELVAMISGVVKTADPWTLAAERAGNPSLGIAAPSADDMRRMMLLAPPELLPYIAMMVPVVLAPGQHTMAAGVLLAALADTSQCSPEAEAELQARSSHDPHTPLT